MTGKAPNPPQHADWTEARIETLKKMWLEGSSASEIALALGEHTTRNAVIGKVTRLKLVRRKETAIRAAKATGGRGAAGKHRGTADAARKARASNGGGLAFNIARVRKERPEVTSTVDALNALRIDDPAGQKLLLSKAWEPIAGATPIPLMQTNERTCKWPIGDAPILFCGLHSDARSPYCEQHRQLATARATA